MTGLNFHNRMIHRRAVKRDPHPLPQQFGPNFTPTWTGQADPTSSVPDPAAGAGAATNTPAADPSPTSAQVEQPVNSQPASNDDQGQSNPDSQSSSAELPIFTPSTFRTQTQLSLPLSSSSQIVTSSSSSPTAVVPVVPSSSFTPVVVTSFRSLPAAASASQSFVSAVASPTNSAAASGSLSTSSIVGIAAGGLVGFGILVMGGLWLLKRCLKRGDRDGDYAQGEYRDSIHVDDEPESFNRPRPPTMIERHFGAAGVGAGVGAHGYFNAAPGEIMPSTPPPANPFMTPLDSPMPSSPDLAYMPAMPHNQEQQPRYRDLTRTPSLTGSDGQHPQNMTLVPVMTHDTSGVQTPEQAFGQYQDPLVAGHYADLQRSSVTPYQAAQYAEISRQLNLPTSAMSSPISPNFDHRAMSPTRLHEQQQQAPMSLPVPAPEDERIATLPPVLDLPRVMSPVNMNVGAYSFPMPVTSPRQQNFSLPSTNGNAQLISIPENAHAGVETPVQYGFHDAPPAHNTQQKQGQGLLIPPNQGQAGRPTSVYDEEDAYGGF